MTPDQFAKAETLYAEAAEIRRVVSVLDHNKKGVHIVHSIVYNDPLYDNEKNSVSARLVPEELFSAFLADWSAYLKNRLEAIKHELDGL